jgi:hypothetical protein
MRINYIGFMERRGFEPRREGNTNLPVNLLRLIHVGEGI